MTVKLIVLGTDKNIALLCEPYTIYALMAHYRPVLNFFIKHSHSMLSNNGKQFPLVYTFLPNKQRQTYERAI